MQVFAILSDRTKTKFMQAMDVFESFKVVGSWIEMDIPVQDGEKIEDKLKQMMLKLEDDRNFDVVALFTRYGEEVFYRDQRIKMVSDGKRFAMVDAIIEGLKRR